MKRFHRNPFSNIEPERKKERKKEKKIHTQTKTTGWDQFQDSFILFHFKLIYSQIITQQSGYYKKEMNFNAELCSSFRWKQDWYEPVLRN